jgi:hypothetical protein
MTEEPLYCAACGAEDWACGHDPDAPPPARQERHCEVCGVIPTEGAECVFYQEGGRNRPCGVS